MEEKHMYADEMNGANAICPVMVRWDRHAARASVLVNLSQDEALLAMLSVREVCMLECMHACVCLCATCMRLYQPVSARINPVSARINPYREDSTSRGGNTLER